MKAVAQSKRKPIPQPVQKLSLSRLPFSRWWFAGCVMALLIAALIRLPFFAQIPNGLNRDEAALGYNAYSLLLTGKDEYGKSWPVSITSFGDQKLPGYVYTLIPVVKIFGLNPFAVRLPSLLAGFVVVFAMGVLVLMVGTEMGLEGSAPVLWSVLTMLFVAISPWENHFSRLAYEAHLAMALFLLATVAYKFALRVKSKLHQRIFLILAALGWSATLLTYHSYHIFTPLFILALLVLDFKKLKKLDQAGMYISWIIGLSTLLLMYHGGIFQANLVKNQGISPFHKDSLLQQAQQFRSLLPGTNTLYKRVLFNPLTEGAVIFAQNLTTIISGQFFFVQGSGHGDNNPGGMNNFHLFLLPFVFLGIIRLWELRKHVESKRLALWVLLGMIAPALTIRPQHEIRLSPIFPIIEAVAALGAVNLWMSFCTQVKKKYVRVGVLVVFSVIVGLAVLRTSLQYLYIIPAEVTPNERYHLLAKTLWKYQQLGYSVITQSPTSSPYIWYVFENKFDPTQFQNTVERYAPDSEGFIHVKRIGKVSFETISWDDLEKRRKIEPQILVFQPQEVPIEVQNDGHMRLLEEFHDSGPGSNGQVFYQVWLLR